MIGRFIVQRPGDYARWLRQAGTGEGLARRGAALFRKVGCSGCHGSASPVHAPSLDGLYGSTVALSGGQVVRADEQYLHDSIMLPNSQVVAGYKPIMPAFGNLLDEEEVLELVAYLKSRGGTSPATRAGGEAP
jgi:cytochrome c oxidase subunit 2